MVRGLSNEALERGKILYEEGNHKFIWLGWSYKASGEVQANQYLIVSDQEGILLDPGGLHVFPFVVSRISIYTSFR